MPWGGAGTGIPSTIPFIGQIGNLAFLLPSGDTSGGTDSANIMQCFSNGQIPVMTPGDFYWQNDVVVINAAQFYIYGSGRFATRVHCVGTGTFLRMFNPVFGGGDQWSGGALGFTMYGGGTGAGSIAAHIGDMEQLRLDIGFENFAAAGSFGLLLDNTIWWTEKYQCVIFARNCATHVEMNVSGALTSTNSYGYGSLTAYIYAQTGQDGVVINNGAFPYHGELKIRGNFAGSNSAPVTNAVLRITGTVPAGHTGAGTGSQITRHHLDIQVETASFAFPVQTINFGAASVNNILGCQGIIDFTQGGGSFAPCNLFIPDNAGTFEFTGYVAGDAQINPGGNFPAPAIVAPQVYGRSFMGSTGTVFVGNGDFFRLTLTANITIDFTPGGAGTIPGPQRKTIIIIQAAVGGPFTVTWPNPGAPTTVNPAIHWAGGVAPTMSAGASATDIYYIETFDGVTWYGFAEQAMA